MITDYYQKQSKEKMNSSILIELINEVINEKTITYDIRRYAYYLHKLVIQLLSRSAILFRFLYSYEKTKRQAAGLMNGEDISLTDIAIAAGVTEVTVRSRATDLRNRFELN